MNLQEIIEAIKTIIKGQAANEATIPLSFFDDKKENILTILKMMQPSLANIDTVTVNGYYDTAVREYKSVYPVDMDPSTSLTKEGFRTWLTEDRKRTLPTHYITRYFTYLRNEGRSENVIAEINRSSEAILSKLSDPNASNAVYTRGLVVGSVQSGKTGNFNAVINRAVDAGYNLVIILSGIMEDLRSQTQLRLELEVIGEGMINLQTDQSGPKGVGKISRFGVQGGSDIPQVISITSPRSDFKKQMQDANFSLNHKNLLVCKKNTGVLKNLLIWLSDYLSENAGQHNIPLLIIDDEADNASLNNLGHKGREYASTINGHIRAILGLFSRKTYLGYTATPFANVLQDRNEEADGPWTITYKRNGETVPRSFRQVNNIFPDDFIELLESPSNYIGAKQIFDTISDPNTRKIPLVEAITDYTNCFPQKIIDAVNGPRPATAEETDNEVVGLRSPRKDDLFPLQLPNSLKDAIECFVLGIAIRLKRKSSIAGSKLFNPHNTMLIHISRFTDWQNRTRDLVQAEVDKLIQRTQELPTSPESIYARLEKTWNKHYAAIVENIRIYLPDGYADEFLQSVSFEDIKSLLPSAVQGLEVKAINGVTKDKLIYSTNLAGDGKKYIAIGGNRLSRGFTLEGLTINYFIRDTNYADTLLQMGRWFGYRPGYIDCCKLFTTWDAIEKFNAATRTIEELEIEFKKMHRLGKTPRDFILRVRSHPGVLQITRPAIMKNTEEVNWSYQDSLVQTTQFEMNASRIAEAWVGLKHLFFKYKDSITPFRDYYILDTDIAGLFDFLDCANSFHKFNDQIGYIKAFIALCANQDKLRKWRVAVKKTGRGECPITAAESGLPGKVDLSVRSGPSTTSGHYLTEFLEKGIFTGSGKSANIVSSGQDMSLWLEESEIEEAEHDFIKRKADEFREKDSIMTESEAENKAATLTKPERIYREKMSDNTGLLVIYLMDLRKVFNNPENQKVRTDRDIDESIPLIGYALGFPPMSPTLSGRYVRGKYNINEEVDEPEAEDFDEETLNAGEESL